MNFDIAGAVMHRWSKALGLKYPGDSNLKVNGQPQIISDLYDALDSQPRNIDIQERLIEVWKALGNEGREILSRFIF